MDIKSIIKNSLSEGIGSFIDSVLGQFDETGRVEWEELLNRNEEALEEAMVLLEQVGAMDNFKQDLKSIDEIWGYAMVVASILNGMPDEEFKVFEEFMQNWELAKANMDMLVSNEIAKNGMFKFTAVNLNEACEEFYQKILALEDFEGGLFAKKKFKKAVSECSKELYVACTKDILNIQMLREKFC